MKILDFYFHAGYQYELAKLNYTFDFVLTSKFGKWDSKMRPQPKNVHCIEQFDIKDYDLAIAHNFYQYSLLKKYKNIPKILIMHAPFRGEGDREFKYEDLKNIFVVFNSYTDQRNWNLKAEQHVIWHGLDPSEWGLYKGNVNAVLVVCRYLKERGKATGYTILNAVLDDIPHKIIGDNPSLDINNLESWEDLKVCYNSYAVFFNPTLESSMPRARAEAMMSGMPVVTTDMYDTNKFIKNGINGFRSNNTNLLKEYILQLLYDNELRGRLSKESRKTATEFFNLDRFLYEWQNIINRVVDKKEREPWIKVRSSTKVIITRKVREAIGGGGVTVMNAVNGLRRKGIDAHYIDVDSQDRVSFVDDKLVGRYERYNLVDFVKKEKPYIFIFDDIERYNPAVVALSKEIVNKIYMFACGTPPVHPTYYTKKGLITLNKRIEKCFVRDVRFARFLKQIYGNKRIVIWIGGCDGESMRQRYGKAHYKDYKKNEFMVCSLNRRMWCKNPIITTMVAYLLRKKFENVVYYKLCLSNEDYAFMRVNDFEIKTEGEQKLGIPQSETYKMMVRSQLALELAYSDAFPRVVNECMNFGLPVLVSSAIDHVYKDKFLTKYLMVDNPNDVYQAFLKAKALLLDRDLWYEVSNKCIEFSSQYNIEQEVETLYKGLELNKM